MKRVVFTAALLSSLVMAKESSNTLLSHAELGYVNTQGTSTTTAISLDAKAKKGWNQHIFELMFDGQYSTNRNIENKNKYYSEFSYDYDVTETFSFGYLIGYKEDKFSSFDYQFYTGPSAKHKLFKTQEHKLTLEGNILYAKDKRADVNYDALGGEIPYPNAEGISIATTHIGGTRAYASYRAKALYEKNIVENLKFSQELSYRSEFFDVGNFFVYSKTAFTNRITDILSAGVSYKIDYVNLPTQDTQRGDRTFAANLIMDF
jgi:putative salt-induced outer membrane protein